MYWTPPPRSHTFSALLMHRRAAKRTKCRCSPYFMFGAFYVCARPEPLNPKNKLEPTHPQDIRQTWILRDWGGEGWTLLDFRF